MEQSISRDKTRIALIQAIIAYAIFCGISLLSRFIGPLFFLTIIIGISFPIIWGRITHNKLLFGFKQANFGKAALWGLLAGIAVGLYSFLMFRQENNPPEMLGIQLVIGIPLWFLIMSPFQEFFFRGWLQPRFQKAFGGWIGLLVTSTGFTLWHFCPPMEGTPTASLPLTSTQGVLSTFAIGMIFGYLYWRTNNLFAPWLAHTLAGIALVAIGLMSFLQYNP